MAFVAILASIGLVLLIVGGFLVRALPVARSALTYFVIAVVAATCAGLTWLGQHENVYFFFSPPGSLQVFKQHVSYGWLPAVSALVVGASLVVMRKRATAT